LAPGGRAQQLSASGSSARPAVVPRLIQFSQKVKGAAGSVAGITFALYKDQEGGAPIWLETQNVAIDADGNYTALLGSSSKDGVPLELFTSGAARWLGVQVQGSAEEQDRVLLVSVPYALKAHEAETLAGRSVSDFVLSEQAVQRAPIQSSVKTASPQAKATSGAGVAVVSDGPTNFTGTTSGQVVKVTQEGAGAGLSASTGSNVNPAVSATNSNSSAAVVALIGTSTSTAGTGVEGEATASTGVTTGVLGTSSSNGGIGVIGVAGNSAGNTKGVSGTANSTNGIGVYGYAVNSTGNTIGVQGIVNSPTGSAFQGINTVAGGPAGYFQGAVVVTSQGDLGESATLTATNTATSGPANGIVGQTDSSTAIAIVGINTTPGGQAGNFQGTVAVASQGDLGESATLTATNTATSGPANGIVGQTSSSTSNAIVGINTNAGGPAGNFLGTVSVTSDGGNQALGATNTATSGSAHGIVGQTSSPTSAGVIGLANGAGGQGVRGGTESAAAIGVLGYNNGGGVAGQFQGNVEIFGSATISGILNVSGAKHFRIDDPIDPANKYLYHASIESSEMKNLYDGVTTLDRHGRAVIDLPDWFEALNTDFRYQLTAIGRSGPKLYVAREIRDHQFQIAGGRPGMRVSWMVTGVRHDAWAQAHPMQVEEEKSVVERTRRP
jgi:hypothetical protein